MSFTEEVKVIPPTTTITLKKDNTEIHIQDPAVLVKKMEERYPTQEIQSETKNLRDKLKKAVSFDVRNVSQEVKKCVGILPGTITEYPRDYLKEPPEHQYESPNIFPVTPPCEKPISKNAYEIRESIIEKSIDIVKYSTMGSKCDTDTMVNKILDVASKLYEFVENKKGRR